MANEIDPAGKGFLTSTGQIKDKKTLAAEENKQSNKAEKTEEAVETSDKSVSSALKSVRSRFTEDVNTAISVVNENEANLDKANENVKNQLAKARELKQAIKDGDLEKQEAKRAELVKLQEEREKIASDIDADNRRLAADRVQTIALGNKQKETIKLKAVTFEKGEKIESAGNKKDVNKIIEELEVDRENLKLQRQEIREVKKEIKGIVKEVRNEIEQIENKSIKSIEEANVKAEKLASDIVKAGSQQAVVSKIDESIVKELLAA